VPISGIPTPLPISTDASPPSNLAQGQLGLRIYGGVYYLYLGTGSSNILISQSDTIGNLLNEKHGVEAIGSGQNTVSVTFAENFANVNYVVSCTISNVVDGNATAFYSYTVKSIAVSGFSLELSGVTPTGNYKLHWRAIPT
jgi:hypothetical protein